MPNSFQLVDPGRSKLFQRILGDVTDVESQLKAISPVYLVNKDSPPLLLIHGDADKTVPLQQSEVLKSKYDDLGLKVNLVVQPDGGHGAWPNMLDHFMTVREWFDKYLK